MVEFKIILNLEKYGFSFEDDLKIYPVSKLIADQFQRVEFDTNFNYGDTVTLKRSLKKR